MNKVKVTKREMKENYRILSVGYCDLQFLLKHRNPVAYSAGVYGWSCDYYDINGVVISTGYSPINSKNTTSSYEMIKEYDDKARKLWEKHQPSYEKLVKDADKLLNEFIEKVKA